MACRVAIVGAGVLGLATARALAGDRDYEVIRHGEPRSLPGAERLAPRPAVVAA